jgi:capsid protein
MRTKICLKAAIYSAAEHLPSAITFGEHVDAYVSAKFDGADYRLRKWIDALGELSAWEITLEQLVAGADEMIRADYRPSTALA